MDGLTLRAAVRLVQERYAGARVGDVAEAVPAGVLLDFGRRLPGLVLSVHPELSGLFPRARSTGGRRRAGPQVLAIRRRLKGAKLTGASVRGVERVATLSFERGSATGEPEEVTLVLEATGRWGNVILVEGEGQRVTAALKTYAGGEAGRSVLPGAPFRPLAPTRLDPCAMKMEDLAKLMREHGCGGLARMAEGLSAAMLGGLAEEVGSDDPDRLAAALAAALAEPPRRGRVTERGGRPSLEPVFGEEAPGSDLLDALEEFYARVAAGIDLRSRRAPLEKRIRDELKAARRLRDNLRREEAEAAQADRLREDGTLVMSHLKEIPRGAAEFVTESPYGEPGSRRTVALDPRRTAAVNAERLFTKARRMKARAARLGKRLEAQEKKVADLEDLAARADACREPAALERLAALLGRMSRRAPSAATPAGEAKAKGKRPARPFLEYLVDGGYRIIVGKDASSNDYILSRVAAGDDVWCHADGYSGAHVIVKGPSGRAPLPPRTLREACMLAAYHSGGRAQGRLNVSYTRRKYVRKPKGAPAGLVVLDRRRTMLVEPSVPEGARLKED